MESGLQAEPAANRLLTVCRYKRRMAMPLKPSKKSVELDQPARVSRIRREPVPAEPPPGEKRLEWWQSDEWEIKLSIAGIIAFALAINIIVLAIGAYWS